MNGNRSRSILLIIGALVGSTLTSSTFLLGSYISKSVDHVIDTHYGSIEIEIDTILQPNLTKDFFDLEDLNKIEREFVHNNQVNMLVPIVAYHTNVYPVESQPISHAQSSVSSRYTDVYVFGMDEKIMNATEDPLSEVYSDLAENEVILSSRTAERLQLHAGDQVMVLDADNNEHSFNVGAIVDEKGWIGYRGTDMAKATMLVSLDTVHHLTGLEKNSYTNVLLLHDQGKETSRVTYSPNRFEEVINGWRVFRIKDYARYMLQDLNNIVGMFTLASIISCGIGIILIFNTFLMITEERKVEFRILRALGMSRADATKLLMIEGAVYALVSSILGIILGIILANVLIYFLSQMINQVISYWEIYFPTVFHIDIVSILYGFSIGSSLILLCMYAISFQLAKNPLSNPLPRAGKQNLQNGSKRANISHIPLLLSGAMCFSLFIFTRFAHFYLDVNMLTSVYLNLIFGFILLVLVIICFNLLLPSILQKLSQLTWLKSTKAVLLKLIGRHMENHRGRSITLMLMFSIVFFITSVSSMYSKNIIEYLVELHEDDVRLNIVTFVLPSSHLTIDETWLQNKLSDDQVTQIMSYSEVFLLQNLGTLKGFNSTITSPSNLVERSTKYHTDQEVWEELKHNPDAVIISYDHQFLGAHKYSIGDMYPIPIGDQIIEKEIIGIEMMNPYYEWFSMWINETELQNIVQDQKGIKKRISVEFKNHEALQENFPLLERALVPQGVHQIEDIQERMRAIGDTNRSLYQLFENFNAFSIFIGIVGLMVISLRIIQERSYELGLLRVIGIPSRTLYFQILFEGLIISICGMTIGVIVGCYTGYTMLNPMFYPLHIKLQILFPYASLAIYYVVAIILISLAISFVAYRMFRVTPLEATRKMR